MTLKGLSVRQTEQLVSKIKEADSPQKTKAADAGYFSKPAIYSEIEISLKQSLGQKVEVNKNKNGSATVKISFKNDEALAEFVKHFSED